jgi:hypothetical protein
MGIKEIMQAAQGQTPQQPKARKPEPTEVEKLSKQVTDHCDVASKRLVTALDIMVDRGLPPELAEYVGEAYGEVEKLRILNKDLLKQYREDTQIVHTHLATLVDKDVEVEDNKTKNKKIRAKYVGVG